MKRYTAVYIVLFVCSLFTGGTYGMGIEGQREWSDVLESVKRLKVDDIIQDNPEVQQLLERVRARLTAVDAQKKIAQLQEILAEGALHSAEKLENADLSLLSVKSDRLKDIQKRLAALKDKLSTMDVGTNFSAILER